jgi:hypothetical protein
VAEAGVAEAATLPVGAGGTAPLPCVGPAGVPPWLQADTTAAIATAVTASPTWEILFRTIVASLCWWNCP